MGRKTHAGKLGKHRKGFSWKRMLRDAKKG